MAKFFENAFPDAKQIFRANPDATFMDFLDTDRLFAVHRREWMTYDLLIQPDVREIVKLIGWGRIIRPQVNLKKNEAYELLEQCKENFERAKPDIAKHLDDPAVQDITRNIFWNNPNILETNPKSFLPYLEPFYLPVRKGLVSKVHRTFEKLQY